MTLDSATKSRPLDVERDCATAASASYFILIDRASEWFQLAIVKASEMSRGPLGPAYYLGFMQLPALGGSYGLDNRCLLPITEHPAFHW
jgi:hypothetical protein